jgi:gag-polypeptide of LTR copia-type
MERPIRRVNVHEVAAIVSTTIKLNRDNWLMWKDQMIDILNLCDLIPLVVDGTLQAPAHPENYKNWQFNDYFARCLIRKNVETSQLIYTMNHDSAHGMWKSLESVHDTGTYATAVSLMHSLTGMRANEKDDILGHVEQLKGYREQLNALGCPDFVVKDEMFCAILATSLPPSWGGSLLGCFLKPHDEAATNITSDELVGFIIDELKNRKRDSEYKGLNQTLTTG